jgi:hypothetical protein
MSKNQAEERFPLVTPDRLLVGGRSMLYFWAASTAENSGGGADYLMSLRDKNGEVLDGKSLYRLPMPLDVPAQDLWSAIVGTMKTKGFIRWSTQEEAEAVLEVLPVEFPGTRSRLPGTRLQYVRDFRDGDERVIVIATNRPIGFWEAVDQPRSFDCELMTFIELHLDAESNGNGVLAVGREVEWDINKSRIVAKTETGSPALHSQGFKQ